MLTKSFRLINFNPRSREGSDDIGLRMDVAIMISIHAPARGATMVLILVIHPPIFQSTLPRGERRDCGVLFLLQSDFNPRSREGSDVLCLYMLRYFFKFQSTLPRGERQRVIFYQCISRRFQSTLPRGERQK